MEQEALTSEEVQFKGLDEETQEILALCSASTKMCAGTLFYERFYQPFCSLHDQIFKAIDSGHPRVAIAAPRGLGKTSIVGLALAARKILFKHARYIVHVSTSHDVAALQTENLKAELLSNPIIRQLFGKINARTEKGLDETFSRKAWATNSGCFVMPRGAGQQVRGLLYHNNRPDLFIVDDLEDSEQIRSEDYRKHIKEWFFADLMKAVSRIDKHWQIVYIDTLKHEDSLLQQLLESPDWLSMRLELCDDQQNSLAPEFISTQEIKAEYEAYKEAGQLDVFYRENRNLPISVEDAIFKAEYFRYYEESDLLKQQYLENVIIVDPAKTVKLHSAESAIVCWGIDLTANKLYFRDCVARKLHPDELYDEIFMMAIRWHCKVLGLEVTSLNEFITQPIKNAMTERGYIMELVELNARGGTNDERGKDMRIAGLAPYYRKGQIWHNKMISGALEAQLLMHPRSKRKDVADAAAYIVEMLDKGDRYFSSPLTQDEPEEEDYSDIKYDPPMQNWMRI